eukprot:scaffold264760_cov30-Tisochrysis_lutea.AAC.1
MSAFCWANWSRNTFCVAWVPFAWTVLASAGRCAVARCADEMVGLGGTGVARGEEGSAVWLGGAPRPRPPPALTPPPRPIAA